jgi:predicted nucleic acid-binding protein
VPAIRHALTEFPPSRPYPDTSFLLNVLILSYPRYTAASAFFRQLVSTGVTILYISSLTWLEFGHAVLRPDFRVGLGPNLQRQYRLDQWQEFDVRDNYLVALIDRMQALLRQFDWYDVAVTLDVSLHALHLMGQYGLKGQDAAHVACAQTVGVVDVASFDTDFRRVDGLHLWTA